MRNQRTVLWATLGGLIVVGSALLIGFGAASTVLPARSGPAAPVASGAIPAIAGPNYTVTFTETGLNNSTNWSVGVCITPWCEDDDGAIYQTTNNTSLTFSLPNGTYYFTVQADNDIRATPDHGNFTVAGASPTPINIHFGNPASYTVTFTETGLAAGTTWAVGINLGWWDGMFSQGNQNNLPHLATQDWNGDSGGSGLNMSNNTSITFSLPNGTYNYTVFNVTNYSVVGPQNGTINVSGHAPAPIKVAFGTVPTYPVTFVEQGLANGTNWTVRVHGLFAFGTPNASGDQGGAEDDATDVGTSQTTSNASMAFLLMNGSYRYAVPEVDGYYSNSSIGTFNVSGGPVNITINFTALPESNVTFNESGLPNGTDWGLRLIGNTGPIYHFHAQKIRQIHAAKGLVTFTVPSGKYHYKLIPLHSWKASGGFVGKSFRVSGANVTGSFVFAPKLAPKLVPLAPAISPALTEKVLTGLVATVRADFAAVLEL